MKAAIFEKPGLENLRIKPDITSGSIIVKPLPHIPGAEISGKIEKIGYHGEEDVLKEGDRVIIHSRVFDGTCDMCLKGLDMLCRNGGIVGAITNRGFAEYIAVPKRNVFKIPDDLEWNISASLPVTTLTPFHALKEASLQINEYLLVLGHLGIQVYGHSVW
ncbi:MAG: alcohol dehydrogenase catalytic domain-containing protein [Nitrososphaeraceae archaeon]